MRIASAIALAMLLAAPARSAEWTDHAPSAQPTAPGEGIAALPLADGGFLLRAPGASHWYAADGQFLRSGEPLPLDGGALGTASDRLDLRGPTPAIIIPVPGQERDCRFARLDGVLDVRELDYRLLSVDLNPPDPAGAQYARRSGNNPAVLRVDADCHVSELPVALLQALAIANAQDAPGAYVLGTAEVGSVASVRPADVAPATEQRLLRISPQGDTLWATTLPGQYSRIALDPAGDGVVLAGEAVDSAPVSHHLARVDAAGDLLWSADLELAPGTVTALHAAADGAAVLWLRHVADAGTPATRVVHVDAAGTATVHELGDRMLLGRVAGPALPPAWLVGRGDEAPVDRQVLVIAGDGALQLLLEPADHEDVLFQLADGRLLLADRNAMPDQAFSLVDPEDGARTPLLVPPAPALSTTTGLAHAGGLTATVASDTLGSNRLRLLDADGALLWERELTPEWVGSASAMLPWRLAFSGDDVCATHVRPEDGPRNPAWLSCVRLADAVVTIPLLEVEPAVIWPPVVLGDGPDRTLLYARPDCLGSAECLVRRALQGSSWSTPLVLVEGGQGADAQDPVLLDDGGVAVAWRSGFGGGNAVHRIDAEGELAWSRQPPEGFRVDLLAAGPDGRILQVLDGEDGATQVEQLDATGGLDWSVALEPSRGVIAAVAQDQHWVIAERSSAGIVLRELAAADGASGWTHALTPRAVTLFGDALRGLAATDQHLALLRSTGSGPSGAGMRLEWLAGGTLVGADDLPAGPLFAGDFVPLAATADAVLTGGIEHGAAWSARREPPQELAAITPSLLGSWYAPASSGQGLFLGTTPDAGVYGGWFTFAVDGQADRADLRWYTLQGSIEPDGTATLAILETQGGAFATAPATSTTPIGSATLRRQDCNHAQLAYAFDAGTTGAIPLQRIAADDCSGTAADSALPAGAFYHPATTGQGLFFEPIASGSGPLLAGLWFTFDPAGAADDPAAQHWFTLGPAAADADGSIVLDIFRTIGGSFDSRRTGNTHRVGQATLQADGCGPATLSWQFDDTLLAGAFAGLEGEQTLQPVAPCP